MLIALDVNDDVVDEAIELGADLIIAHHAIIYRPLKRCRRIHRWARCMKS